MSKTVLLSVPDSSAIDRELEPLGAHVSILLPGNLVVARVPESFQLPKSGTVRLAVDARLDAEGELSARAFFESRAILANNPPGHGLPWDAGFEPPGVVQRERASAILPPTSLVMTGNIAVGIIVVSGPTDTLKFTAEETGRITAQCVAAFDYLSGANPEARISFRPTINRVSITTKPLAESCGNLADPCEAVFTYPAVRVLGYDYSEQYAQSLQRQPGVSWSYVAYFTKYPTYHPAYADPADAKLVIQYSTLSGEPNNIHRTFAHESCHIFGAADEYENIKRPCECGGSYGYLGVPNGNCVNCPGVHFTCLMDQNDLVLCTWSRRQIGWNAWSEQTNVAAQHENERTPDAVALAEYNGKVWMVYRDIPTVTTLYASAFDGSVWSEPAILDIMDDNNDIPETRTEVGLAAYGPPKFRKLWMVHKGKDSATLYASAFNGTEWGSQTKITDVNENGVKSSDTPALAEFNGKLWMAYRGENSPDLSVCSFNGSTWGEQTTLTNGAKTSKGPALAVYGRQLWLVYRGEESSNLFACSYNGMEWSLPTAITGINGARTSEMPSLGVLGDLLWLVYRSASSSDMWSCAFDGTTWLEETQITRQNGANAWGSIGVAPLQDVLVAAYRTEEEVDIFSCFLQQDAKIT